MVAEGNLGALGIKVCSEKELSRQKKFRAYCSGAGNQDKEHRCEGQSPKNEKERELLTDSQTSRIQCTPSHPGPVYLFHCNLKIVFNFPVQKLSPHILPSCLGLNTICLGI